MEVFRFINWIWRSWELWQKTFVVAMILNLSSLLVPAPYNQYLLMAGILPLFIWTGKWWIWDRTIESYKEYKKQRDGLFDTIKGN